MGIDLARSDFFEERNILLVFLLLSLVLLAHPSQRGRADEADFVTTSLAFKEIAEVTIDDVFVIEGERAVFTVSLSGPVEKEIEIDYSTADGTAREGVDYEAVNGTISFSPGETKVTISVPTLEDQIDEPDETFFLDLSDPEGPAVIGDGRGVGTIVDDDGQVASIVIGDDSQYEGNPEQFSVSLSNPVPETITLSYYTMDGSAIAGEDYEGVPKRSPLEITFRPGETEKVIVVETIEDVIEEPDETFTVILADVSGPGVIVDGEGVGTILDDDAGGEEEEEAGEAGEIESCRPLCPPVIPLVKAKKSDQLIEDIDGDGSVDPGDMLRYKVVFTKVPPSDLKDLTYLDPLSPHLQFVEGSLSASSAAGPLGGGRVKRLSGGELIHVDFPQKEGGWEFPLQVNFSARVKRSLPQGIGRISGQGIVYSEDSPTVVTDDPGTIRFDDPTYTYIGKGPDFHRIPLDDRLTVVKEVTDVKSQVESALDLSSSSLKGEGLAVEERLIGPGSQVGFAVTVRNNLRRRVEDLRLVNPVDSHLKLKLDSVTLEGKPVEIDEGELDRTGFLSLDLASLAPGEEVKLTYRVQVKEKLHPDLGHLGTNAYVTGGDIPTYFSDDPTTELLGDRTTLLLPTRCEEDNYLQKWRLWLERLSNAEPSLTPVILSPGQGGPSGGPAPAGGAGEEGPAVKGESEDEEEGEELAWVLFGGDVEEATSGFEEERAAGGAGGIPKNEGSVYQYWPRYALFGAGELDFEPGSGEIFVGLSIRAAEGRSAGGAGGVGGSEGGSGGFFVQSSSRRPFYTRLSGTGLEKMQFGREGEFDVSNVCGKEYLPYIMDIALSGQIGSLRDFDELLRIFRMG